MTKMTTKQTQDQQAVDLIIDQLSLKTVVDLRVNHLDRGWSELQLADAKVRMPTRMAMMHILLWQPFLVMGVTPSTSDIYDIKNLTEGLFPAIRSRMYGKLICMVDRPYMEIVAAVWDSINDMYQWIVNNLGEYQCSVSAQSMCRLLFDPKVKPIVDTEFAPNVGTSEVEKTLQELSKKLCLLLSTPGEVENNVLLPFMQTHSLKDRQIPQMLIAYGARSDIDDTMFHNVISSSAMGGLKNVLEYAIEAQSAKKASYFNKVVICDSQYFNRRLRLTCSSLMRIYPGDCGSTSTLPIRIEPGFARNFEDKVIVEDGKTIRLTPDILPNYYGKVVQMFSPICCRHTDGVCAKCCGRGSTDIILKYFQPDIHIGLLSATKVGSVVSQMVLSAKHLINTLTKIYNLPETAKRYFVRQGDRIYWNTVAAKNLIHVKIRIPFDALGPITDLSYADMLPDSESYSKISWFELYQGDTLVDRVDMNYDCFIPYLSEDSLAYIRQHFSDVEVDTDHQEFTISLSNLNPSQPFLKYTIVNDDMIKFTKGIDEFLNKQIGKYTSAALALQDFLTLLYSKTKINVFYPEMIIKSFLISSPVNYAAPTEVDVNKCYFGNMKDIISEGTLSMKLSYERLGEYFVKPETSLRPKAAGLFDPLFGI